MDNSQDLEAFVGQLQSSFEKSGLDLDQVTPFTPETLDSMYSIAYTLYEQGKYDHSASVFRILALLEVDNRKHWMGLGASLKMLKHYDEALKSYAFAAVLDESDPLAHFHAAECFLAQGNVEKALTALDSAETVSDGHACYQNLRQEISMLRQIWIKSEPETHYLKTQGA
jgi:type III secretion system low calcium response chaperone LcrH/SycD